MTGITEAGITVKTYDECVRSLERRFKLEFGDSFDTTPESPDGQNIRIMAAFIYDQWLLAEQAYHSYNPSVVTGTGLDNLVRLNGLTRIVDTPTRVGVYFDATTSAGEVLPAGTVVETATDKIQFVTTRSIILPGEVIASCLTKGAIAIFPGEITVIADNVASDITVTNPAAGITGVVRETDPQLRARRERSLVRAGTATAEAIYSAVTDLNLSFIAVLENDTDAVVDGIPPHSFRTVVEGGALEDVAERIYRNKAIGIQAYGDVNIEITDSRGYPHMIGLSRPSQVPIWVKVKVKRPSNVAINSLRDIRDAMVEHINGLQIATDVEWGKLYAPATNAAPAVNVKLIEVSTDGVTYVQQDILMGPVDKAKTDEIKVVVEELP